jgi:hypothetical protein
MYSDEQFSFEPTGAPDLNPFGDPRTIPTGWNVSAFYTPEHESLHRYGAQSYQSLPTPLVNSENESSADTL